MIDNHETQLAQEGTPGSTIGVTRRSLLAGVAGMAVSHGLAGCTPKTKNTLRVRVLNGTIPAQMVSRFRTHLRSNAATQAEFSGNLSLDIAPDKKLATLFALLQLLKQQQSKPIGRSWLNRQPQPPHLVTLGDYWLTTAIRQGLIQPLDPTAWSQWSSLPERWQHLVRRDQDGQPSSSGPVWAAPYGWGTTVIAYRADRFAAKGWQPPTDWADLWRPELQNQISLLDNPREVIGLTLKHLGSSYNQPDLTAIPQLSETLAALNRQAKLYSSSHYLQPLILGDTTVAVGWSTDILPLIRADRATYAPDQRRFAAVIPASGTALWANLWVQPAYPSLEAPNPALPMPLVNQWIDFCWQPSIIPQLSLLSGTSSPNLSAYDTNELPKDLQAEPLLIPDSDLLKQSEFLFPLTETATSQYQQYWRAMRQPVT